MKNTGMAAIWRHRPYVLGHEGQTDLSIQTCAALSRLDYSIFINNYSIFITYYKYGIIKYTPYIYNLISPYKYM